LNSKYLFYFSLFFILISCGVKGPPVSPENRNIPSFIKNYEDIHLEDEEINKLEKYGN